MVVWKRKDICLGDQNVSELTILEWKPLFSLKYFHFHKTDGDQDRFHTHAFNAFSVLLSGDYVEEVVEGEVIIPKLRSRKRFLFIPKDSYHRITKSKGCRTLLITGPWGDEFKELVFERPSSLPGYSWWRQSMCGAQRKIMRLGTSLLLRNKE